MIDFTLLLQIAVNFVLVQFVPDLRGLPGKNAPPREAPGQFAGGL